MFIGHHVHISAQMHIKIIAKIIITQIPGIIHGTSIGMQHGIMQQGRGHSMQHVAHNIRGHKSASRYIVNV